MALLLPVSANVDVVGLFSILSRVLFCMYPKSHFYKIPGRVFFDCYEMSCHSDSNKKGLLTTFFWI